jgi:hypothetical protein
MPAPRLAATGNAINAINQVMLSPSIPVNSER